MSEEKVLAIVLLAGSGLVLILTIAIICIIIKCVNTKTKSTTLHSEIPMAKTNQEYHNKAVQPDGNTTTITTTNQNETKTTETPDGGQAKGEWPTNYNMCAISRSYAFPKTGDPANHSNAGSRPESIISTKSYEISHKTFSEEVFEGVKQVTHYSTASVSSTGTTDRPPSGVWKYHRHTPSQTPSQHSVDRTSIASSSTATSHPPEYHQSEEKPQSYYSTFKSKKSPNSHGEILASQNGSNHPKIFTQSQRQRISSQTVDSDGDKKVFAFSIK